MAGNEIVSGVLVANTTSPSKEAALYAEDQGEMKKALILCE